MRIGKIPVRVGSLDVGPGFPVFVIAEIGASHSGRRDMAVKLVEEAAKAGVNAVKLQTIQVNEAYLPGEPSYEVFKGLWLEAEDLEELMRVAEKNGVLLFSTAGDLFSLDLMLKLGMPLVKVSSGLMTHHPLIAKIAKTGLPMILSTGMSYLHEVLASLGVAEEKGSRNLMVLHCTSSYPASPENLNLLAMKTMDEILPYPVGYSDHSLGSTAVVAACSLGARLIEKHFILDRSVPSPDRLFAAEPKEMKALVEEIRKVEKMLGSGIKEPVEEEKGQRSLLRRCLMARRAIQPGEVLTDEMISIKRPRPGQKGLPPSSFGQIVGMRVLRPVAANEGITLEVFGPEMKMEEP